MLELRLNAEPKRIAAMRVAIARACRRRTNDAAHADLVSSFVATLATEQSSSTRQSLLVIVTEHTDVTSVMMRFTPPADYGLTPNVRRLLERTTSRWTTMSGRDARTILAEIPVAPTVAEPVPLRLTTTVPAVPVAPATAVR